MKDFVTPFGCEPEWRISGPLDNIRDNDLPKFHPDFNSSQARDIRRMRKDYFREWFKVGSGQVFTFTVSQRAEIFHFGSHPKGVTWGWLAVFPGKVVKRQGIVYRVITAEFGNSWAEYGPDETGY